MEGDVERDWKKLQKIIQNFSKFILEVKKQTTYLCIRFRENENEKQFEKRVFRLENNKQIVTSETIYNHQASRHPIGYHTLRE